MKLFEETARVIDQLGKAPWTAAISSGLYDDERLAGSVPDGATPYMGNWGKYVDERYRPSPRKKSKGSFASFPDDIEDNVQLVKRNDAAKTVMDVLLQRMAPGDIPHRYDNLPYRKNFQTRHIFTWSTPQDEQPDNGIFERMQEELARVKRILSRGWSVEKLTNCDAAPAFTSALKHSANSIFFRDKNTFRLAPLVEAGLSAGVIHRPEKLYDAPHRLVAEVFVDPHNAIVGSHTLYRMFWDEIRERLKQHPDFSAFEDFFKRVIEPLPPGGTYQDYMDRAKEELKISPVAFLDKSCRNALEEVVKEHGYRVGIAVIATPETKKALKESLDITLPTLRRGNAI